MTIGFSRWARASAALPAVLLLAGCGLGAGNYGPDGQLPPAPSAPEQADYGAPPAASAPYQDVPSAYAGPSGGADPAPGASYAPPQEAYTPPAASTPSYSPPAPAAAPAPDDGNSYRTADGVVHVIPRRGAPQQRDDVRAPAIQPPPAEPRQVQTPSPPQSYGRPPAAEGPQGSSEDSDQRHDEVGYAGVRSVAGNNATAMSAVVAVHPTLPAGAVVELTSLDTGHTILALVTATMPVAPGHVIDLSPGAARQLGAAGTTIPVRVRRVVASPGDIAQLRTGQAAGDRIDAPAALVAGLRHRLGTGQATAPAPRPAAPDGPGASYAQPGQSAYAPPVRRPAPPTRAPRPAPAASSHGYFVQVAALSTPERAQALARSLGGSVRAAGRLYKVQLGPYATADAAQRARAGLAGRGYPGAVIVNQ